MPGVILVVSDDPAVRDTVGEWLDSVGLEVMSCPGPTGPDYTCVGGRSEGCPLAHASDVVVLDTSLAGQAVMEGASTDELLGVEKLLREEPLIRTARRQPWPKLQRVLVAHRVDELLGYGEGAAHVLDG